MKSHQNHPGHCDAKITANRKQKSTLATNFLTRASLTLEMKQLLFSRKELTASTVARLTSNDVRVIPDYVERKEWYIWHKSATWLNVKNLAILDRYLWTDWRLIFGQIKHDKHFIELSRGVQAYFEIVNRKKGTKFEFLNAF